MSCDHVSLVDHEHYDTVRGVVVECRRCLDCGAQVSLGTANDSGESAEVERWLGDELAQNYNSECIPAESYTLDDLNEAVIDVALDFLDPDPAPPRPSRPRSPIEQMVDRACGYVP